MQVIYIDVLFLLNLVMDFLIFRITSIFLNYKVPIYKLLLGSILASILYCVGILVEELQQLPTYVYQFFVPILSILYMYKPTAIKTFLKDYISCLIAAWGVGGISFNLYYMTIQHIKNDSLLIPILSGCILWIVIESSITFLRKRRIGLVYEYKVVLEHRGGIIRLKGYLDTGNRLYTTNHQPVTIMTLRDLKPILSEQYIQLIEACQVEDPIKVLLNREDKKLKLYLIPYDSVGCKNGLMIGIVIEKMVLTRGTDENVLRDCVIGVTTKKLFKGNDYDALIHPECISIK